MANSFSADEVRERNIQVMGKDLGEVFTELSNQLTWQFWRWSQFEKLFGNKESRITVLNSSAPMFFGIVQDALWLDTLLGISRLAGPASTGHGKREKQNLSIRRLPDLLVDVTLRTEVSELIAGLGRVTEFAMDWRNRHIAHRDLDLSLGRPASSLPPASRLAVNAALDGIAEVLNCIDRHYFDSATGYRSSPLNADAEDLLFYLQAGLKREALRQKLLEVGEYRPEDWEDAV